MNKDEEVDLRVRLGVMESDLKQLKRLIGILAGAAALPNAPELVSTLLKAIFP